MFIIIGTVLAAVVGYATAGSLFYRAISSENGLGWGKELSYNNDLYLAAFWMAVLWPVFAPITFVVVYSLVLSGSREAPPFLRYFSREQREARSIARQSQLKLLQAQETAKLRNQILLIANDLKKKGDIEGAHEVLKLCEPS